MRFLAMPTSDLCRAARYATAVLCTGVLPAALSAQTLFSEDFEGNSPAFTLNTTDAGSVVSSWNTWVINNSYTGGSGDLVCLGFPFGYNIVNTPTQPAGITSANGRYLHTASVEGITDGITNCSFGAADGLCITADNTFSRMSSDVNTVGAGTVELKFWWLCSGGSSYYGQVYYSTDGGASWTATSTPAQYNFQGSWTEQTVNLPAFAGQATLRFGFRFVNAIGSGATDPGFGIDDVRIIADNTSPAAIVPGAVSPLAYCQGADVGVPYTVSGTFNPGNVFTAQLSDAAGSFALPVVIGSVSSVTGGTIAAIIPPGTPQGTGYRIRVTSSAPVVTGADNGADITILIAPYAGPDAAFTICEGDDPVALSTGGDAGGTWTGPSPVTGGLYDPATMDPGTYTYTVAGSGPCGSDAASVVVSELAGADAGVSVAATICKNTGIHDLFALLGGTPDAGGTWTNPGGMPHTGLFNSDFEQGGIFTYTVAGGGSCGNDEAVVAVTLGQPGQAGPDGAWSVCSSALPVDLFDMLEDANLTGLWYQNGEAFNGVATAAGEYLYVDFADQPCANDTAFITLLVTTAADAGMNGTAQICPGDAPASLITFIGGTPQPGGAWTGPGGSPHSGTFVAGTDPYGLYTYTIAANGPCAAAQAVLAVLCEVGIAESAARGALRWLGTDVAGQQTFDGPAMTNAVIDVLDAAGRQVLRHVEPALSARWHLATGMLAPGAYTLLVRHADGAVIVRFAR